MNVKHAILLTLFTPTCLAATPPTVLQLDTGLVIAPFAVPVATPVAVLTPANILYNVAPSLPRYSQQGHLQGHLQQSHLQQGRPQQDPGIDRQLWIEFEQFRQWQQSRDARSLLSTPPRNQISHINNSCLQCHSGTNPKGDLSLDADPPQHIRLRAIRAVITGKMPPKTTLTPQQRAQLLLELATPTNPTTSSITSPQP